MKSPLNKVVFIQRVAAFAPLSLTKFIKLAYVNNSWADTIQNYSPHLFEKLIAGRSCWSQDSEGWSYEPPLAERALSFAHKFHALWLMNALVCEEFLHRSNCLVRVVTENPRAIDEKKISLVLDKIIKVGNPDLLKAQVCATFRDGITSLMYICAEDPSIELIKLMFQKTIQLGGAEVFKNQLTATHRYGQNSLMFILKYASLSSKILRRSPPSVALINYFIDKSVEVGGLGLLKSILTAVDGHGWSCLALACGSCPSSPEIITLISRKIVELGGSELLKDQLAAVDSFGGTCLAHVCSLDKASPAPAVMRLIAALVHHFGLFKKQYQKLTDDIKTKLKVKAGIKTAAWVPDSVSVAGVKKILEVASVDQGSSPPPPFPPPPPPPSSSSLSLIAQLDKVLAEAAASGADNEDASKPSSMTLEFSL